MIETWLSPTTADPETATRGRVLNMLALVIAVMAPLYAVVTTVSTPDQITAGAYAALGAALLLSLACYWLGKRGRVQLAGYLLFAGLFAAISLYMVDSSLKIADLSTAPALYLLIALPAGLVLHPLSSFAVTTLAGIYTAGLLWLAPPPAYAAYQDRANFLSNVVLIFALAYILSVVTWTFGRGLGQALRLAEQQNLQLRQAGGELEKERQLQAAIGEQIAEVAERLAKYSTRQASGASRQAAAISQVSTSIQELHQTALEIALNASDVDRTAQATLQDAHEGEEVLSRQDEAMQLIQAKAQEGAHQAVDLEENLDQIGRVAGVISTLAAEIQLVAFNATLEAAEAGEAGQRFGVVAAEVKDLATDSIQQARQVGDFLRRVQEAGESVIRLNGEQVEAVETGASLAARSGTANQAVIASVSGLAQQASQIQQTTEQQQQASEQIVNAVQEIQAVVDRWVVSSHQMDTLVSQLRSLAEQLA
ncbi:MAG: methyl-accepting chemotaxis protein [Anaerolineae bacterium]|jgi:hypothetical protein